MVTPAEPSAAADYPDHIAQTHTTLDSRLKSWELGLQGQLTDPGSPAPSPDDLDQDQGQAVPQNQLDFDAVCPGWAVVGECENYHPVAKAIHCNREWCQGECGGEDGPAHQRRKAMWLPRARQIEHMGAFVLTIPSDIRWKYRTKEALAELGKAAKRMMQRHGFERGLRRYHFFGEWEEWLERGEYPPYHPHLEILVGAQFLPKRKLRAIKRSWANILGVPVSRANIHYRYIDYNRPDQAKKKLHRVGYALRPTFLDWRWDPELAEELAGFRNANSWGGKDRWSDDPVWDIPPDPDAPVPSAELVEVEAGRCGSCGCRIKWLGVVAYHEIKRSWRDLGGGYFAGYEDSS